MSDKEESPLTRPGPLIIAHRGFSGRYPENTLRALREALALPVDGCEIDTHRTADGVPVLLHDATVNRTTDGKGAIRELTLEQVRALDAGSWKGAEFAGEKVPTLAEALNTLKGRGLLVIEIKAAGMAAEVVWAVRKAGSLGQCVVFSFDDGVVRQVAELEPRLPAIWLLGQVPVEEDEQQELLLDALESRCAALAPHYGALTPEFVRRAHRLGLGLWAWTVDDPAAMRRVAALGADALITNWPDRAVAVVGERET
jgi:glycerophosphoryl diester phosphodiesterase